MWLAPVVVRPRTPATRYRTAAVWAALALAAVLAGCGSSSSSKVHERSEAGLRATIQAAEAEFRAGNYQAFCEDYLSARLRSVIETAARGKTCAELLGEQAVRANEANVVGVLKSDSHIAVTGDSATVFAPHERALFVYSNGQWRDDWSEEVK